MYKSTFFLLFIIFLAVIFMLTRDNNEFEIEYYDEDSKETSLYLLNEDNRLVEVKYNCTNNIEEIFNLLTINANKLPLGVRTALPYRLKLESFNIEDNKLYLNIDDYDYNDLSKTVEALTWTYTDIDGIDEVYVNTNNFTLKASREKGINKTIEAFNLTGNKLITVYYLGEYVMPISYVVDENTDDIEFIINKTIDGTIESIVKENSLTIYLDDINLDDSNFDNLTHTINVLDMFESVNVYLNNDLIYSRYL